MSELASAKPEKSALKNEDTNDNTKPKTSEGIETAARNRYSSDAQNILDAMRPRESTTSYPFPNVEFNKPGSLFTEKIPSESLSKKDPSSYWTDPKFAGIDKPKSIPKDLPPNEWPKSPDNKNDPINEELRKILEKHPPLSPPIQENPLDKLHRPADSDKLNSSDSGTTNSEMSDRAKELAKNWKNNDLMFFGDAAHGNNDTKEAMSKYFADLYASGCRNMAFEFLPQNFDKSWLQDGRLKEYLARTEAPCDHQKYIEMVEAAVKAGLNPVGLEKSELCRGRMADQLHGLLKDDPGRKAVGDYMGDASARRDSEYGKALEKALESSIASTGAKDAKEQAAAIMKELDMMKNTGADLSQLQKQMDSLLHTEALGKQMAGMLGSKPEVAKAFEDYAKDDSRKDSASGKALIAALTANGMKPEDAAKVVEEFDKAKDAQKDYKSRAKEVRENNERRMAEGAGSTNPELDKALSNLSGPARELAIGALGTMMAAFNGKWSEAVEMDWRNKIWADRLNGMKGTPTAVFAGDGHFKDRYEFNGKPWADSYGYSPKTLPQYLHERDPSYKTPYKKNFGTD